MKFTRLIILATLGATALAACGSDAMTSSPSGGAASATVLPAESIPVDTMAPATATGTLFNEADVEFARGMIPHHGQAIVMADRALDPATGARTEVIDLAKRIKAAQDPEITTMTRWMATWHEPMTMDTSASHSLGGIGAMGGAMSPADLTALEAAKGLEFDALWLAMMIEHHRGAIAMAETVKASGKNPEVLILASSLADAQQAEIDEMQNLLAS
jgi:uncharacterized protein (DUF305 family)